MDSIDKKLLNQLQKGLPIEENPFHRVGEELGITGEEVVERLQQLKESGYIRRIGGVFDSARLGLHTTLVGIKVHEDFLHQAAENICRYPGVTHCYRRNGELNLWFTLIARDETKKDEILRDIADTSYLLQLYDLPKERCFSLNVFFDMEKVEDE